MIETPRLTLIPLSLDQLRLHLENGTQLETSLGLQPGHREVVEPLLSIVNYFTVPRLKDPDLDPLYHTVWIAIDRHTRQIVADAKFKGEPDETGTVEIGYGTYPAFQHRGYMSEIVGGLVSWVSRQPDVRRVMADTDVENLASQRVLQKNGFLFVEETEGLIWWELDFKRLLHFNELGNLTPPGPIKTSDQIAFRYFGGTNSHRNSIWQQYLSMKQLLISSNIPVLYCWIDGSFVTGKPYPNDLDIVFFVPEQYKNQHFSKLVLLSQSFRDLDVFWIGLREQVDSLASAINELELFRWRDQFGSDRSDNGKGFLEIR